MGGEHPVERGGFRIPLPVDGFPVFYDLIEYRRLDYGMTWMFFYSCWLRGCSDLTIGDPMFSGEGVSDIWIECQPGPIIIPGWGSL